MKHDYIFLAIYDQLSIIIFDRLTPIHILVCVLVSINNVSEWLPKGISGSIFEV